MLLALFVQNTNTAQGYVVCCVRTVCNKLYLLALLSHCGLCGAVQEICIFPVTLASWVCESLCTNWGKHSEGCSETSLALRLWFCYLKLNWAQLLFRWDCQRLAWSMPRGLGRAHGSWLEPEVMLEPAVVSGLPSLQSNTACKQNLLTRHLWQYPSWRQRCSHIS